MIDDHSHSIFYWECSLCDDTTTFNSQESFITHLTEVHKGAITDVSAFVRVCLKPKVLGTMTCPLCSVSSSEEDASGEQLLDHVAEHIHSFALGSLPLLHDDGNDDSFQRNAYFAVNAYFAESDENSSRASRGSIPEEKDPDRSLSSCVSSYLENEKGGGTHTSLSDSTTHIIQPEVTREANILSKSALKYLTVDRRSRVERLSERENDVKSWISDTVDTEENLFDKADKMGAEIAPGVGNTHSSRFDRTRMMDDLEEAIRIVRQAVAATPDNHLDLAGRLSNLGDMLNSQYACTGAMYNLEEAVQVARQAVAATPDDHPDLAGRLNNLGDILSSRYARTGAINDLEEAIRIVRQAVAATPDDHPDLAGRLSNLGSILSSWYARTGAMYNLEEAVQVARQAVAATPDDHPDLAGRLNNLGDILSSWYARTGAINDLEEAIQLVRQAVAATPSDHPDLAGRLNNLGDTLSSWYARTGAMDDLEEAVQVARQAVAATPSDHPDLAGRLSNLGDILSSRYDRTGAMDDLEEAIRVARQAVAATPDNHPGLATWLGNLGDTLSSRYARTGAMDDLEEAIKLVRQAVAATPDDHPDLAGRLSNLGDILSSRYARTGATDDLEEAIRLVRQAVATTPDDHLDLAGRLSNLGSILSNQYARTGAMDDLEEAIRVARQAVAATPNDHPDLAGRLSNLGSTLSSRYARTGAMDDLEEAIQIVRQAVAATPDDHPGLAGRLSNLGDMLNSQYACTGAMNNLEEAVQVARQAVAATPDDHPGLATWLGNLGDTLSSRYARTGAMDDIEEALQLERKAVAATPDDHPDLAGRLSNLGNRLSSQYDRTGAMNDLEEAIRVARQAVAATPDDHPGLATWLGNLGDTLSSRYARMGAMDDLEEAIQVSEHAWRCVNATPFVRLRASTQALRFLQVQQYFERAYRLAVDAIDLLPYVHNRSLDHQDQQYVVSHFSGLATTACALALQTGKDPEVALEVLEKGRGVILRLLMDDRSNTSELKAVNPELCARYESLQLEVNKPAKDIADDKTQKTASTTRIEALAQLEKCVQDIQQLPGFSQFHRGLTAKQMQSCSTAGSIVIVNITNLRSDAIIVTASAFKVLPLPGLSAGQAKDWINQDLTTTTSRSDRGRKNKAYLGFLSWLWRECARPVLDELHCHAQPSADDLPRIWWIGAGLASTFPFHSAGDVSAGIAESTYSRAVSSYTPTIKALQYSQGRASTPTSISPKRDAWRALIVTMPTTPRAGSLKGTKKEKAEVTKALEPFVSVESLEHPDAASTIAQLQECNVAHFACHSVSDPSDPSKSGLILQKTGNRTGELQQDILSVQAVSQTHLSQAEIAYLSASSTAQNKVTWLSDEVLHVVSGFQVAGFRHVVGCLWPSDDMVCVEVARSFYVRLFQGTAAKADDNRAEDDRAVALALHRAVVKVRESEEYRKRPLSWAQYVHFGA
jgi:tetratricopeptide (TPR) repeat protein